MDFVKNKNEESLGQRVKYAFKLRNTERHGSNQSQIKFGEEIKNHDERLFTCYDKDSFDKDYNPHKR